MDTEQVAREIVRIRERLRAMGAPEPATAEERDRLNERLRHLQEHLAEHGDRHERRADTQADRVQFIPPV